MIQDEEQVLPLDGAEGGAASAAKPDKKTSASKGKAKGRGRKKKAPKQVPVGMVHIKATYNNTLVTFTDLSGNVLAWASAGVSGFKGPKKSTPYAASIILRDAAERVKPYGMRDVAVFVKGVGSGREGAIRALNAQGFQVMSIKDVTPIPHNGCRPKKVRRV